MTVGVGLFGTITAFLANVFIKPEDDEPATPTFDPIDLIGRMEEIKSMLLTYEETNSALKAKIESLERILEKNE
jgi:hypothetical protein